MSNILPAILTPLFVVILLLGVSLHHVEEGYVGVYYRVRRAALPPPPPLPVAPVVLSVRPRARCTHVCVVRRHNACRHMGSARMRRRSVRAGTVMAVLHSSRKHAVAQDTRWMRFSVA